MEKYFWLFSCMWQLLFPACVLLTWHITQTEGLFLSVEQLPPPRHTCRSQTQTPLHIGICPGPFSPSEADSTSTKWKTTENEVLLPFHISTPFISLLYNRALISIPPANPLQVIWLRVQTKWFLGEIKRLRTQGLLSVNKKLQIDIKWWFQSWSCF